MTTSQPSAASTRAVASFTPGKNTCCTQPVSMPTTARRGPCAGTRAGQRAVAGRRAAASGADPQRGDQFGGDRSASWLRSIRRVAPVRWAARSGPAAAAAAAGTGTCAKIAARAAGPAASGAAAGPAPARLAAPRPSRGPPRSAGRSAPRTGRRARRPCSPGSGRGGWRRSRWPRLARRGSGSSGGSARAGSPSPRPTAGRSGRRAGRSRSARSRWPARAARRTGRWATRVIRVPPAIRSPRRTGRATSGARVELVFQRPHQGRARAPGPTRPGVPAPRRGAVSTTALARAGGPSPPADPGSRPRPSASRSAGQELGHRTRRGAPGRRPRAAHRPRPSPPTAGSSPARGPRRPRRPAPRAAPRPRTRSGSPCRPVRGRPRPVRPPGRRASCDAVPAAEHAAQRGRPLGHPGRVAFEQHRDADQARPGGPVDLDGGRRELGARGAPRPPARPPSGPAQPAVTNARRGGQRVQPERWPR